MNYDDDDEDSSDENSANATSNMKPLSQDQENTAQQTNSIEAQIERGKARVIGIKPFFFKIIFDDKNSTF